VVPSAAFDDPSVDEGAERQDGTADAVAKLEQGDVGTSIAQLKASAQPA
jgi:hypothetical protein